MIKLNLGCGRIVKARNEGWVNVDHAQGDGIDLVLDLNALPYPFKDGSVEEIYASHLLEHLDYPFQILKEWHRILRPGGRLELKVPHKEARGAYVVTHRSFFDEDSLMPVASASAYSSEHQRLFAVERFELHHNLLNSSKLTYFLRTRLPWSERLPLGRVTELRWILVKV